jgi:hypothetical protein
MNTRVNKPYYALVPFFLGKVGITNLALVTYRGNLIVAWLKRILEITFQFTLLKTLAS